MTLRTVLPAATLAATLVTGAIAQAPPPSPATPPRLVVLVVMDQFTTAYIDRFGRQWTGGLRRMLDRGAYFTNARYPYAVTLTCPGHSTIGTGVYPYVHGMMGNSFFDRQQNRAVACMTDPTATSVPFGGGKGQEHQSPRAMRAPTFAQLLREQGRGGPQVVSVALKPRSAIGMAGRGGPGATVVWEEDDGTWATSDAYTTTPWPDVDAYVRAHPIAQAYGEVWDRLKPASTYLFEDDGPGEAQPAPWTRLFPHPLVSPTGKPDTTFVTAWERSPWSDAYVMNLALELLRTRRLGTTSRTDMLAVSLPALDLVAHEFGPHSHEAQDVLLRADALIARLLDAIDKQVGRGRYVVAFTSDHGTMTIPERLIAEGVDAGRISTTEMRSAVNLAVLNTLGPNVVPRPTATPAARVGATPTATPTPGPPNVVTTIYEQEVALAPGVMDKLRAAPGAVAAVKSAIAATKGIAASYSVDDITNPARSTDPLITAWRLSLVPERAGDFVFVPKPGWIVRAASGSTHGTPNEYDQRVPLMLFGAHVRAGRYTGQSSPVDIAPTLAWFTKVKLPQTNGRVLAEALSR